MSKYIILIVVLFFTTSSSAQEPYKVIENQANLPILTPSFANRETLKIELNNGLQAYLISDPDAVKSAATLVVRAGSWADPQEYPGLAHFLEHMLFLGTEKYPIESDYDRFIKEHDGESNAYTTGDHTLYAFSVHNKAFEEALDRFSQFFKKPLFNPSGVSRELQAIDQEFAKNFTQDAIREHYVLKELGHPQHPFHNFNSGNSSTLSKVSQKTLRQWYKNHYSANLMLVIIYSPLPLSTLKELATQNFSGIPNYELDPLFIETPLISNETMGKFVYVEPLKDVRAIRLMWELPSRFAHMMETKPSLIICHILGHEGPGSLLAELKKENLAEELECSGVNLGPDHFLVSIYITLTEEGLKQYENVIQKTFEAIQLLKQQKIPQYIFDEVQKIATIHYQYQSKEDPFDDLMKMGELLVYEDLSTFPEQTLIPKKFDPDSIQDLLNYLTPERALITLLAKPTQTTFKANRVERWMGVPYSIQPILNEDLVQWQKAKPNHSFYMPEPNPFIPKELKIEGNGESNGKIKIPHPEVIFNRNEGKIYHQKDLDFQLPYTMWFFEIKTPQVDERSSTTIALADLYVKTLKEALNSFSYNAKVANLNYSIERVQNGIGLSIAGFHNNAELLFDAILKELKTWRPSEQLFQLLKESLLRKYQNFTQESSLKQGLEAFQSVLFENYSTSQQKANALKNVSYQDFINYIEHLYDQTFTEGLLYGNIDKEHALKIWNKLQKTLSSKPYPSSHHLHKKVVVLPENKGPFFLLKDVEVPGNAAVLAIEEPIFSFKTRAAQQILTQAMNGPFYAALRTKQQTAYIVYNTSEEIERHLFTFFAVQSNTHDPRDLLARFELFIESFLQEMAQTELTQESFENIKASLILTLEQPPQSMEAMALLLKSLAFKYNGDFDWINKRIEGFKNLSYEEFLEMVSQSMGRLNKRRFAVLVQGQGTKDKIFQYNRLQSSDEIRKLSTYEGIPNF